MSTNTPKLTPVNATATSGVLTSTVSDDRRPSGISPQALDALQQSDAAFARDLPKLLVERPGQWAVYMGSKCLGFASTKAALYRQCLTQGLPEDHLLFCCIEPQDDVISVGSEAFAFDQS